MEANTATLHPAAERWVEEFTNKWPSWVRRRHATDAANRFTQLGVEPTDGSCSCEDNHSDLHMQIAVVDEQPGVLSWLHRNHLIYNQRVWSIVKGDTEMLVRAYERDLQTPSVCRCPPSFAEYSIPCDCARYGRIALRSYARGLIDHFLRGDNWR